MFNALEDEDDNEEVSYYFGNTETQLLTQNSFSSLSDEDIDLLEESKTQAKGFEEAAGGWDYIPFGLRQVYEAASHINRMFNERNKPQTMGTKVQETKQGTKVEPIETQ